MTSDDNTVVENVKVSKQKKMHSMKPKMYSIVIFKIFWRGVHGVVKISREVSDFGT